MNNLLKGVVVLVSIGVFTAALFVWHGVTIPERGEYTVTVAAGATGRSIASTLRADDIISSTLAMRLALALSRRSHAIQAGNYTLDTNTVRTVFGLARVLTESSPLHTAIMVTIPEGSRGKDILSALENVMSPATLEGVTAATFDEYIGYLFPDTYAIDDTVTAADLIVRMQDEYEENIAPLRDDMIARAMSERDVIVLASIIEREANDEESMRRVAGILHNRLTRGMRLQVDATLTYLLGKTSAELTQDDLALKSPYNTYRNEGLPPGPIANPGLLAIKAVLNPLVSDSLFYLTGDNGIFYYAKTHDEHLRNKARYVR